MDGLGDVGVNGQDRVRSRSGQAWQAGECLLGACCRLDWDKVKQEQEVCRQWLTVDWGEFSCQLVAAVVG
jgi:hypothetical protein